MNTENLMVLISSILITIIAIITIIFIIINFNNNPLTNIEGFLGCGRQRGKITSLVNKRESYNNMNNTGRLVGLNRGPVPNFHQRFTGGLVPELQWRTEIENKMGNLTEVSGINGELIQQINPIDNVYSGVEY